MSVTLSGKQAIAGGVFVLLCVVLVMNSQQTAKNFVSVPGSPTSAAVTAAPSVQAPVSSQGAVPSSAPTSTLAPTPASTEQKAPSGVPSKGTRKLNKVYHVYFQNAVIDEMGTYLAGALYDPAVLIEAMNKPGYMAFVNSGDTQGMPATLNTPDAQIADVKRATSLSLGRMHRDISMQVLYDKCTPAELVHFDRSIRHLIRGQVRQAVLKIQTIVSFGAGQEHLGPMFAKRVELFEGHDPVWAFLNAIPATATADDIKAAWKSLGSNPKAASETPVILHPAEQLFHIEYHRAKIGKQDPHLQKYMYTWRPTASCFEMQRECEAPDGCRYYCNFAYLQNAVDPSLGGKPYHHRFLGFGSNNQYDWEISMIRYMGYEKFKVFNKLHSMTSFDCTLATWNPPQELKTLPVGWGGASFCVGDVTGKKGSHNFVAFSEMKQRILESEVPGNHPTVLRNKMEVGSPIPVNTEYFDEVSILKCDIEGSEIQVLYTWSNGELASFNNNAALQKQIESTKKDDTFLMVDFSKIIPEYFTVSTVLMEIHGWGPHVFDHTGFYRTQHHMQQLTQMGFISISLEKNFFGNHAYEVVFVHYRYFVRSEIWSYLRGNANVVKETN